MGCNLAEMGGHVTVTVGYPGFELGISASRVSGDSLRVAAERKVGDGDKRSYGRRFQRSATLPAVVTADQVEKVYRNGVLELTLPKAEHARCKKINVKG